MSSSLATTFSSRTSAASAAATMVVPQAPGAGNVAAGGEFGMDFGRERGKGRATVARELSSDQIAGLNAGRALVDRADARISQRLGGAGFLDESHAAVDLDARARRVRRRTPCTSP